MRTYDPRSTQCSCETGISQSESLRSLTNSLFIFLQKKSSHSPQEKRSIKKKKPLTHNRIHDTLLHTLHSHPQNWPTLLQNHALSLLRSGTCTTFPDLMTRVLQDIKADTEASAAHQKAQSQSQSQSQINSSSSSTTASSSTAQSSLGKGKPNGVATTTTGSNGKFKKKGDEGGAFVGRGEGGQSLALPRGVVEEGVRITRECLEAVCEVDE